MDPTQFNQFLEQFTATMTSVANAIATSTQRSGSGARPSVNNEAIKNYPKYEATSRFDIWLKNVEARFAIRSLANDVTKIDRLMSLIDGRLQEWIQSQDATNKLQGSYEGATLWLAELFSGTMKNPAIIRDQLEAQRQKDNESVLEYLERKTKLFRKNGLPLDIEFCRNVTKGIRSRTLAREIRMQVEMPLFVASRFEEYVGAVVRNMVDDESSGHHRSSRHASSDINTHPGKETSLVDSQCIATHDSGQGREVAMNNPEREAICRKCGKQGHLAYRCNEQTRATQFKVAGTVVCRDCFERQSDPRHCHSGHFSGHR